MLKAPQLFKQGFHLTTFPLPEKVYELVLNQDWQGLDEEMKTLTQQGALLYDFLKTFHDFKEIEFIISLRDASSPWEEDGIWHDDGSRVFAFSLSLTLNSENIEGGRLGIRPKGEESFHAIPTPEFGQIILFLTGAYGFEHKIHRVSKGIRIIIAGWCS
jgi:hypothetical protein